MRWRARWGIDTVRAGVLPGGKAAFVGNFKQRDAG